MIMDNEISNYRKQSIQRLRLLQDQLKRQFLLLDRQQKQTNKIKKQIESTIHQYYTVLVQKKGLGKVITQDKLNNSYNFVKDLVLSISKDIRIGFQILILCNEATSEQLSQLLLAMFYDNFNQNDAYLKKTTLFAELLGKKIVEEIMETNFMKNRDNFNLGVPVLSKVMLVVLRQFTILEAIKEYFEMLANRVLNKIPKYLKQANKILRNSFMQGHNNIQVQQVTSIDLNHSQSISLNRSTMFQSISQLQKHEVDSKIQQIVQQYKTDILSKSQMMPISLRVLCSTIHQNLSKNKHIKSETINTFIWQILENSYFRPFQSSNTNKWNHFKNTYFINTVNRVCQLMKKKVDAKFLGKFVQRVVGVNQDKIHQSIENKQVSVAIHGGCVSYRHLYFLFKVVKDNDKHLKQFNERVTNRANKIFQMNPNFQFFKTFNQPSTSYLVFFDIVYSKTLQKDHYLSLYSNIYPQHKIKQMLKQILIDPTFHILPYIQRQKCLKDVLEKIVKEQEIQGEGSFSLGALQHSQQFLMKIKFLFFLLEAKKVNEVQIFQEMIKECLERQHLNVELFKMNKIQLLQCLTTVSKAKKIVKAQKQAERNVDAHLKIVRILDTMQINLCITGPSCRPAKQKYLKTGNRGIVIEDATKCSHQQNIEEGLKHHASSVQQALHLYCQLKQVKHSMQTGKDTNRVYESLSQILDYLKQTSRKNFNVNMEEFNFFQTSIFKVIMREIHERLVENKDKSNHEIEFQQLLKSFGFIKPNRIKIQNRDNLSELQQVWQIACRYLRNINQKKSATQKIESVLQMIEIIKISLRKQIKNESSEQIDKSTIEIVLAYCLIRSRPDKILTNINFIQLFLSKDKLLAKEGAALQRLKNAVSLIQDKKLHQFLILDGLDFQDQFFKNMTVSNVEKMREDQKAVSMIGYI